ncbi:oxidoreductase [Streptomyces sp. NPDC088387]|uniref:oxidoreductase n=1 Tax=Streptomyces sp. NPDC088387 TaxID=3365859 RepID=UPI00382D8EE4
MTSWNTSNIPDLTGRTAVVTGGNAGIGFETARALAERGAEVVLASRNVDRTKAAAAQITGDLPGARVSAVELDLGDLASVRAAAEYIKESFESLDLLINNAGVNKTTGDTRDGFETQFGINHLGTFALTGLLIERLLPVRGSRVVTVSSVVHRTGRLDLSDLTSAGNDHKNYARSKLANLLFTYELSRRLAAAGAPTLATAAHPGIASTDLSRKDAPPGIDAFANKVLGRTAERGALPTLRAATDPTAPGGAFYGPGGFLGLFGDPAKGQSAGASHDRELQQGLWVVSERLTEVTYPLPAL